MNLALTPRDSSSSSIGRLNDAVWSRGGKVHEFRTRALRAPEAALFDRYQDDLAGRVLELGCGTGRLSDRLIPRAAAYEGIDIAADMVAHCRRRYPAAEYPAVRFVERNIADLSGLASGSVDAIVAGANLIDVLDHDERQELLADLHRILAAGGLLIFSSHNRDVAPLVKGPLSYVPRGLLPAADHLVHLPQSIRNRRRLAPLERTGPGYAIVNDPAFHHSLLHYYIDRDGAERQLAAAAFKLLVCLDLAGQAVQPGEAAPGCHELHYAARSREP